METINGISRMGRRMRQLTAYSLEATLEHCYGWVAMLSGICPPDKIRFFCWLFFVIVVLFLRTLCDYRDENRSLLLKRIGWTSMDYLLCRTGSECIGLIRRLRMWTSWILIPCERPPDDGWQMWTLGQPKEICCIMTCRSRWDFEMRDVSTGSRRSAIFRS